MLFAVRAWRSNAARKADTETLKFIMGSSLRAAPCPEALPGPPHIIYPKTLKKATAASVAAGGWFRHDGLQRSGQHLDVKRQRRARVAVHLHGDARRAGDEDLARPVDQRPGRLGSVRPPGQGAVEGRARHLREQRE